MLGKLFSKKKKEPEATPAPEAAQEAPQDKDSKSTIRKGRERVAAKKLVLDSSFKPPVYPKDQETASFIYHILYDSFVFAGVDHQGKKVLVRAMQEHSANAGDIIIKQGDIGDFFYILEDGKVNFEVDGKEVGSAEKRAVFGELALLYDTPRAATVRATTSCKLWKIDQETFRFIMVASTKDDDEKIYSTLRKVELFKEMSPDFFVKLSSSMTIREYKSGELIIKKGDVGNTFYVVKDGRVSVTDIGFDPNSKFDDHELAEGGYFGERALLTGDRRAANITSLGPSTLLCLDRVDFEKIIGPLDDLLKVVGIRSMINGLPAITKKKTDSKHIDALLSSIKKVTYRKGMSIMNVTGKGYYFIFSGRVETRDEKGLSAVQTDGYFGSDKCGSRVSVQILENTECGFLPMSSLVRILASAPDAVLGETQVKKLSLKDLKLHKMLGEGSFGKVFLVTVREDKTKTAYALKMMNKKQLLDSKQVNNVVNEKNIMAAFDHPFIVNLYSTFQDTYSLYMVIGLAQGGELYQFMQKQPGSKLKSTSVQFYTACVLEGLAHLHSRKVCHRDVKPENVLLGNDGYCVIIDMGFSKIVEDKTFTLCGTPVYLAPEILVMKGHNKGVDYWALGVLIYECLVGYEPFYADDQTAMFKKICKINFSIPRSMNKEAADLVEKLLIGQKKRFGCLANGDKDIRDHPFYKSIDWDDLLNKKITPPWAPKVRDALDTSNFDPIKYRPERKVRISPADEKLFRDF